MRKWLFLLFTVVPVLELYLLIQLGRLLGPLPTVAGILVTGLAGAALAKAEGVRVLWSWRQSLMAGRLPEDGLVSAGLLLVGGALLITPGVLTDVVGLLLLIPPTRRAVAERVKAYFRRRLQAGAWPLPFGAGRRSPGPAPGGPGSQVIDVDERA